MVHKLRYRIAAVSVLLGLVPWLPWAANGDAVLRDGIALFKESLFSNALRTFREILLDPELGEYTGDAYFWISKSYMALKQYEDAERNLEFFLTNFTDHAFYPESVYQKGRLLFLQQNPEGTIQVLGGFLERYPESPFVPNAYFWIGESLFTLGHLNDAQVIFERIIRDYPKSFKVEAARYRNSIIDFKKRETELLKLLKWSHEESLKAVEEFHRREKDYEQAIVAYQRRLAQYEREDQTNLIQELEQQRNDLETELNLSVTANEDLERTLSSTLEELALLRDQTGVSETTSVAIERKEQLLLLKEQALAVQESLVDQLASQRESRR